jgi:hypothetical protein
MMGIEEQVMYMQAMTSWDKMGVTDITYLLVPLPASSTMTSVTRHFGQKIAKIVF